MILDLVLAIFHHLLVFILFAVLAVELVWLKPGIERSRLRWLARLDMVFGLVAAAVLAIGTCRVFFGAKGYQYYFDSPSFWAKIVAFLVIGALSVKPTLDILRWRRRAEAEPGFRPAEADVRKARRFMHVEATIFPLIPIFAAAMARGY